MATAVLILLILGLVCFLVATVIGYGAGDGRGIGRTNFLALGLAFWILTQILAAIPT